MQGRAAVGLALRGQPGPCPKAWPSNWAPWEMDFALYFLLEELGSPQKEKKFFLLFENE